MYDYVHSVHGNISLVPDKYKDRYVRLATFMTGVLKVSNII